MAIKIGTHTQCVKCGANIVTTRKGQMLCDSCQAKIIKQLKSDTQSIVENLKHVSKSKHAENVKSLKDAILKEIPRVKVEAGKDADLLLNNFLRVDVRDGWTSSPDVDPTFKSEDNYDKALKMKNANIEYMQIFDWMETHKVIDMLRSKLELCNRKFYARKLDVRVIKQVEANRFLKLYHMQGAASRQTYCVGLFDTETDELLQVQTFGASRFGKEYQWEAIRLATKHDVVIIGGVSRGFARFVRDNDPDNCLSYVDSSRSAGATDEKTGLRLVGHTGVQATWVNVLDNGGKQFVKQSSLRFQGIDRLLGLDAGDFPDYQKEEPFTSNDALMFGHGYLRVYDAGSYKYVYERPE